MAFVLRRPFAVASTISKAPAVSQQLSIRAFHNTPLKGKPSSILNFRIAKPASPLAASRTVFQATFKRAYQQPASPANPVAQGDLTQRLLWGAGIFGATLLGINLVFNRETREDGGMPLFEREYLNDTFLHTGLGIGIIGVAATALHRSGWSIRLMTASPWMVVGLGLAGSIGTMMGAMAVPPENYVPKYVLWTAFNVSQAALLSPLLFMSPAILARAGLYTVGMMGSIAVVGATAKQEKYLYLGGPLLAGCAIVALSGFAPLVLPATAARTLMWTENIWLYGGLAVFGGFTLYDVQKILYHARMAQRGLMKRDAVNESISLELDFINIFVRLVQILAMSQGRKK